MLSSFNWKSLFTKVFCASSNDEFSSLLDNPYTSDEEKDAIRNEINTQEHQPGMPFSRLTSIYSSNTDENWNGLKFSLNYKPNQLFSMDYAMILEKGKKLFSNIQTGCMCYIPTNQANGIMLVGRKSPPNAVVLQSHFILSPQDKLAVICQHPKEDMNQAMYTAEYSHDFDRMTAAIKCSSVDPLSISLITSLYKNIFIGTEAYKKPEKFSIGYNYSLWLKNGPRNPLGISLNYLSTLPGLMCDITYKLNMYFNVFLSGSYSWNPMITQMGSIPTAVKAGASYNSDNVEFSAEINSNGEVKFQNTLYVFKNIGLQMNLGFNAKEKMTKKSIKHFGFGLKLSSMTIEEGFQQIIANSMDESVKEYEYDKLSKKI